MIAASKPHRAWIAVASAEHARRGRAEGFMQVCHGKGGPLARIQPGDTVIYYSPTERMGGGARLQAFTALGLVRPGQPYQVEMGPDFHPFRRDVTWADTWETPIAPLLDRLSFTAGQRHWGARFRFGLFQIPEADLRLIQGAMGSHAAAISLQGPLQAHAQRS